MSGSGNFKKVCAKYGAHWDPGITRLRVLNNDDWICKMEICLYGDRRIDPDIEFIGPGVIPEQYGSVDHIVALSVPGTPGHVWSNVRAAHRSCNREASGLVWLTHQLARDWLDEHAEETTHVFAIQIGVVKTEGSPQAPPYRVVARPMEALGGLGGTLFPPYRAEVSNHPPSA